MSWFVLAAGLGAANFITVALLFRRLRANLNRQLSNMRAERNSEWILSALKAAGTPDDARESTAQAVNGNGLQPPPDGPQPVRRKRHLGLFLGGGVAAALLATLQEAFGTARKTRHGQLMAGAVGLTVATAATLVVAAPWHHPHQPPAGAPTATITATAPPPQAGPSGAPTASTSPHPGATVEPSHASPNTTAKANGGHLTAVDQRTSLSPQPPPSRPPGNPTPAAPGQGSTPPAPPASPSSPVSSTPVQPPAAGGPCVVVDLNPLLALRLCPLGGG